MALLTHPQHVQSTPLLNLNKKYTLQDKHFRDYFSLMLISDVLFATGDVYARWHVTS